MTSSLACLASLGTLVPSPVLAGAFGTFMLFVLAGLVALALTAVLDRAVGKEVALLLWAGVVLVLVFLLGPSAPAAPRTRPTPEKEQTIPAKATAYANVPAKADPFAPPVEDARNPFLKHSDTRPLDPVEIEAPLWTELEFPLPPTIPGPAPSARRLLRGALPTLAKGDGSTIPPVPAAVFLEAKAVPEDVYDWVVDASKRRVYVYILGIQQGGVDYPEGKPGFEERKWLLPGRGEGFEDLRVKFALVSGAEKKLAPTDVANARRQNVSEAPAAGSQFSEWHLRRSVENLWHEALQRNGLRGDLSGDPDIGALQRAAREMAEIGPKEGGEGWRRTARLLRVALGQARQKATPAVQGEILVSLLDALSSLHDEQGLLEAVAEYARVAPARAEPWLWLGKLHLAGLQLAPEALTYFRAALAVDAGHAEARLGEADALTGIGSHEQALQSIQQATPGYETSVRRSEALIRLGRADAALAAADEALRAQASSPRAVLARGAALYAKGDLPGARDAFVQAATMDVPGALAWRAQALYDLGLTAWRMGQADAALAAFDECDKALQAAASPARFPDETVSPALGRALVAYAMGDTDGARLDEARAEAPQSTYLETFAGVVASRAGNDALAARAFERALRLGGDYPELDGWLARTQARLGRGLIDSNAPATEARAAFEASVAFAERATATEEKADPKAYLPHLREAWTWIHADHVTPARKRFEAARDVVDRVLNRIEKEQPAAFAIRAYCQYRLADYDRCIRDFDDVLRVVPADDPKTPWKAWRDYAEQTQAAVKRWRSLEEKTVEFDDPQLATEWQPQERSGVTVRADPEKGRLAFRGTVTGKDGSASEPTVVVTNKALFEIDTFERLELTVSIPTRDREGNAMNNVTFGAQVQKSSRGAGSSPSKTSGIGVFFDKGMVAARAGGGQQDAWRDGEIHRLPQGRPWPEGESVRITIVREDRKEGTIAVYLGDDPEPILRDKISGFRESRGQAELWLGGYGNQAQPFQVEVGRVRVVRTKKT